MIGLQLLEGPSQAMQEVDEMKPVEIAGKSPGCFTYPYLERHRRGE